MNYYERHLGDYARDAGHLSMLEHGAYTLLLDRYYVTEKGIPADQVYRIARANSKPERAAVDRVLNEFFKLEDGAWINGRTEEEIVSAHTRISAAQENGKKGGRPKKQKPTGLISDNPEKTQSVPVGFELGSENKTQQKALQSPISNLEDSVLRTGDPPSVDQALYAEARVVFGDSIGGQISKAIKLKGKPWVLGLIESCRRKDQEQARSYFAAAMNGAKEPDAAEKRRGNIA